MSNRWLSRAFENISVRLPGARFVLVKLADNANDDGICWPSISTLCRHTGFSERAVQGHIKTLVDLGVLEVLPRRFESGRRGTNEYRLIDDSTPAAESAGGVSPPAKNDTSSPADSARQVNPLKRTTTSPSLRSGDSARAVAPALPGFEFVEKEKPKTKPGGKHALPDDFAPNLDAAVAYWRKRGREDLVPLADEEATTFRAHYRKTGKEWKDWDAAWRSWYVQTPEHIRAPYAARVQATPERFTRTYVTAEDCAKWDEEDRLEAEAAAARRALKELEHVKH